MNLKKLADTIAERAGEACAAKVAVIPLGDAWQDTVKREIAAAIIRAIYLYESAQTVDAAL